MSDHSNDGGSRNEGAPPRTHLLSNGAYSVMLTAAGSGYSRWRNLAVTRWREDPTCDNWGSYIFLRDVASGLVWSAGYQPTAREPESYDVSFREDGAEIRRKDGHIVTSTEFLVAPEDAGEVRRVSLTNTGSRAREIELTTYSEVVLTGADTDAAHPAFAKMFIQTEFVPEAQTLLARRRSREPGESELWAAHRSVLEGDAVGGIQFETDRARFLGRGNDVRNAVSILDARPLSNSAGTVLDPVLSLRRRVRIARGETAHVAFWTLLGPTRDAALGLADKYGGLEAFSRAKSWSRAGAGETACDRAFDPDEADLFQRAASHVLYANDSLRASGAILRNNRRGPEGLWAHGISGDLPIVLVCIDDENGLPLLTQLLRAHDFWRSKCLATDLIVLRLEPSTSTDLHQRIDALIGTPHGTVHSLRGESLASSDRDFLHAAARAIFVADRGTLSDQLRSPPPTPSIRRGAHCATSARAGLQRTDAPRTAPALEYFNGLGGFALNGREYVTVLDGGRRTPAPWVNVVANPQFGFQVSADGAGCTWARNARENQLTPWSNDPVGDLPSETIYLRDEATGDLWSATPLPIRQVDASYVVHHGFGYTRFETTSRGICVDLLMFVPLEDSLKISRLKITNRDAGARRLSIVHYVDWVLGNQRTRTAPFIVTEMDPATAALFARNPWRGEFREHVAFMDMGGKQLSHTADRREFLGPHGVLAAPEALLTGGLLSKRVGGGLDPCGALHTSVSLAPGESVDLVLLLGEAESAIAAAALVQKYREVDLDVTFKAVEDHWTQTLGMVQVKTPDRTLDILCNGWLLYQTLACRLWARSGFYQTSGAYGYRDQLQDVMALCVARPLLVREHILRASARQFTAGDVQHWWLPTSGQGIQTRVSDDRVWLPFVVARYLEVTEDRTVLDEAVPFLEGMPLAPGQNENFAAPAAAAGASLYEHCARALDSSLAIGPHGLPLFGTGDWNDGMNRVGAAGRGESVWLGWFLIDTLRKFAPVAEQRGEVERAACWHKHAFGLQQAIEREAWDGDWYRRGYFDDGSPLGSVTGEECRIDALAQSWAVISGAGDQERALRAMSAVNAQLVSRSDGLVKLFTPPFDHGAHDPGYVRGYPPGLRENGGQYTHGALWTTLAFALMGDGDRAGELFSLLNPINHASTGAGIHRYKVEPYVICADVYSAPSHVGRGGWTWYTGSAGWMYRTGIEGILGFRLRGNVLSIDPCIPRAWGGCEITYKHGASRYHIAVDNPHGVTRGVVRALLDEVQIGTADCTIVLADDDTYHYARITLG